MFITFCLILIILGMKSEIFGTQFDGFTPLHIATYQNDLELVQSILENNLDTTNYKNSAIVNSKFNNGLTPGDVAAKYRYVNVSKYLGMYHLMSQLKIFKSFFKVENN